MKLVQIQASNPMFKRMILCQDRILRLQFQIFLETDELVNQVEIVVTRMKEKYNRISLTVFNVFSQSLKACPSKPDFLLGFGKFHLPSDSKYHLF
jgi:hypothetical protein